MDMPKKQLVAEALIDLHRRLNTFPIRSHERRTINAKPREIKSFLSGQLASGRTQELQSELLAAGIPL
jgi:hypothetical protein